MSGEWVSTAISRTEEGMRPRQTWFQLRVPAEYKDEIYRAIVARFPQYEITNAENCHIVVYGTVDDYINEVINQMREGASVLQDCRKHTQAVFEYLSKTFTLHTFKIETNREMYGVEKQLIVVKNKIF